MLNPCIVKRSCRFSNNFMCQNRICCHTVKITCLYTDFAVLSCIVKRLSPLKRRIPLSQLMALSLDDHQMLYVDRLLHFLVPQLAASTASTPSTVVTLPINTISAAFKRLIVSSSGIPKVKLQIQTCC